jgi:hypothetical protein
MTPDNGGHWATDTDVDGWATLPAPTPVEPTPETPPESTPAKSAAAAKKTPVA